MKKILYNIAAAVTLTSLAACSYHEIPYYEGVDAIYFDQQYGVAWFDTVRQSHQIYSLIPFGSMASADSLLEVKVETTGYVRDYDRPFGVEVVTDSTSMIAGTDYDLDLSNAVIRAGQNSTRIKVHVYKTDRLQHATLQLQLRLVPGEHFTLPFGDDGFGTMPKRAYGGDVFTELSTNFDPSIHNIFAHIQLKKPAGWNNLQFGAYYSATKYALILKFAEEQFGWHVTDFEGANSTKMLLNRSPLIAAAVAEYLMEQYNKGREYWVLDEDGSMMYVKGVTWAEGTDPNNMV